jgi:hypothetical protein
MHPDEERADAKSSAKQTQVASEVSQGQMLSEKLHKAIDFLGARLEPVLRQENEGEDSEKTLEPQRVSLARTLGETNKTIQYAIRKINELVDRLEI